MKFNHDADKVGDVFVGYELDESKVKELARKFEEDPLSVLGGKKSETAEYLHSIADDPEALIVTAMFLVRGIAAARTLDALAEKAKDSFETMDITNMPKEVAEEILASADAPEVVKDRVRKEVKALNPSSEDVADEFEMLKRKYR